MAEIVTNADNYTSLCHPDSEKSCFFCCPPLRPYAYDPLRHRSALEPALRQNRESFLKNKINRAAPQFTVLPINGWDCWGLGFLDDEEKKVGCLLHPFQNDGLDYRHLVGYERKCGREICLEAKTFEALSKKAKTFYLDVTAGMDSFEYSSRTWNPIFPLLLWGREVCETIAETEGFCIINRNKFKKNHDSFINHLSYKTDGYLIERIIVIEGISQFNRSDFLNYYRVWKEKLVQKYRINYPLSAAVSEEKSFCRPVHLFETPLSFSRFLKFSLNTWTATEEKVATLKKEIDLEIDRFVLSG